MKKQGRALLLALAMLVGASCGRGPAPIERGSPVVFSLAGVKFQVANRDSRVFPSEYVSKQDQLAEVRRAHNFSLCVSLPKFFPQPDRAQLRACRDVHQKASDYAVLAVHGRNLGLPPPTPDNRPAENQGFASQLKFRSTEMKAYAPPGQPRITLGYEPRPDEFGLHALYPTHGIDPSTDVVFWKGTDVGHVGTLIGCSNMLPEQKAKSSSSGVCKHEFLLPSAPFGGYTVDVTIYYSHHWLPEWQRIETDARAFIERMRKDAE